MSWQQVLITERYTRRPDSTCLRFLSLRDTPDVLTASANHWEIHQMSWQQVSEVFITERYTRCPGSKCLSLRDTPDVLAASAWGVYHRLLYHYTPELSIMTIQNRYQLITCPSIKQWRGRNYFMRRIPKSNVHQGCITSACYNYCSMI